MSTTAPKSQTSSFFNIPQGARCGIDIFVARHALAAQTTATALAHHAHPASLPTAPVSLSSKVTEPNHMRMHSSVIATAMTYLPSGPTSRASLALYVPTANLDRAYPEHLWNKIIAPTLKNQGLLDQFLKTVGHTDLTKLSGAELIGLLNEFYSTLQETILLVHQRKDNRYINALLIAMAQTGDLELFKAALKGKTDLIDHKVLEAASKHFALFKFACEGKRNLIDQQILTKIAYTGDLEFFRFASEGRDPPYINSEVLSKAAESGNLELFEEASSLSEFELFDLNSDVFKGAALSGSLEMFKHVARRIRAIGSAEIDPFVLCKAARSGNFELFLFAVLIGGVDLLNNFSLMAAAESGNLDIVRLFITNAQDRLTDADILNAAARLGDMNFFDSVREGAEINSAVISNAAQSGNLELFKHLIKGRENLIDSSVLRISAMQKDLEFFKIAVKNVRHIDAQSLLISAGQSRRLEVFRIASEAKKGECLTDSTVLGYAALCGDIEFIRAGIEKGAVIDNYVIAAAMQSENLELIRLLTQNSNYQLDASYVCSFIERGSFEIANEMLRRLTQS